MSAAHARCRLISRNFFGDKLLRRNVSSAESTRFLKASMSRDRNAWTVPSKSTRRVRLRMAMYARITSAQNATATRIQVTIGAWPIIAGPSVPVPCSMFPPHHGERPRWTQVHVRVPANIRSRSKHKPGGAGYQQIQKFCACPTGEFRAQSVSGQVDACQHPKTQRENPKRAAADATHA